MNKSKFLSRRRFIGTSAAAIAGFTIVPNHVVSGLGHRAPSDKLNVAGVGIGGRGAGVISVVSKTENIVSLCDVDWSPRVEKIFSAYPKARRHKDYRAMLDQDKDIDGVIIATPDHTHAIISLEAMRRGKHVYTEKPLTHTIKEARILTEAARKYKVATQMGNGGQAADGPRRLREMIWDGAVGPIREVHIWTDRPNRGLSETYWPQGVKRPQDTPAVPQTLDWDLFIGPAPMRPYHPSYHPFNWRGWWDFGTGALGDMGCHGMDPIFRALKLKYPTNFQAVSTLVNNETYPLGSMVTYEFPAREKMPAVLLTWYDGGLRPPIIRELEEGGKMGTGGTLYIGEKGNILNDVIYPRSLRDSYKKPDPYIKSSPGHEMEWILACKGGEPAGSNFDWAGPLTETVLLGNIPLRPDLRDDLNGQILSFDPLKLEVSLPKANKYIENEYRNGWKLEG
ncbi:MAG TPA: Gfo/Idh/MocA family oxidoreductase [Bacteroidales bacterium]|nr:Gfo/Idh/MocA family oxidoreductase [Bacteroidales bacterium]